MTYTEQLEHESERARQELANSLEELRARISPGQIVDQLVDYVQDGSGGEFFRNLKQQTVGNPLPVTLVGAGLAWLMLGNGTTGRSNRGDLAGGLSDRAANLASRVSDTVRDVNRGVGRRAATARDTVANAANAGSSSVRSSASAVGDAASDVGDRITELAGSTAASAKDFANSTSELASDAYGRVVDGTARATAALSDTASAASRKAAALSRNAVGSSRGLLEFCAEQPLLLLGLGLAIGGTLGALLPATRTENRLVGEASDHANPAMHEAAESVYEKSAAVDERGAQAAHSESVRQGFVPAEVTPEWRQHEEHGRGVMREDGPHYADQNVGTGESAEGVAPGYAGTIEQSDEVTYSTQTTPRQADPALTPEREQLRGG